MLKEILENQLTVCQACHATNRFPLTITDGMLPVRLICPKCGNQHAMNSMPAALPKVIPHPELTFWTVLGTEELLENSESSDEEGDSSSSESKKHTPFAGIASFATRSNQISNHLLQGMKMISMLRTDIDAFEKAMFRHFSDEARIARAFGRWNAKALRTFVLNPTASIQVSCEDKLMEKYTRLVVAPGFYRPECGFLISEPGMGGMSVELINSYSRLNFPITDQFAERIGVPINLDLTVFGNKIFGSSLPYCYKDIPGTVEDHDHNIDHPSISIHTSPEYGYLARQWLAKHAVTPWSRHRIIDTMIRWNEPLQNVLEDDCARVIWKRFKSTGRTAVFTSDMIDGRRMIGKIIAAIKGLKLIIYGDQADQAMWHSMYPSNTVRDIAFMGPEDHFTLNAIKDVHTIVVDSIHKIEVDRLIQLYGYTGYLIVLCNDPILDFAEENDSAAIVHSLVHSASFDMEEKEPRYKWRSPINRALRKLQGLTPIKRVKFYDSRRMLWMYETIEYFI